MIDLLTPEWGYAVWINIATSITVAVCLITFIIFGWVRRNRLEVVQDGERLAITAVLIGLVLFFVGRGIQIGIARMTVAQPWFLAIGMFLAVSCVACTVIVCRNHDEYGVLRQSPAKKWDGRNRRSGNDRRQAPQ